MCWSAVGKLPLRLLGYCLWVNAARRLLTVLSVDSIDFLAICSAIYITLAAHALLSCVITDLIFKIEFSF